MADQLDESVSNGTADDTDDQETAETGPAPDESVDTETSGGAIEPGSEAIEDVDGYRPLTKSTGGGGFQPESAGGAETADPTLDDYRFDIGNASFGFGPETVHGMDDRVQIRSPRTANYPWRVHSSLLIKAADNSNWIGTGWFISPNVLITAGHVVHINGSGVPGRDGWVNQIRVIPGRDGNTKPYGEATSGTFYSVRGWTEHGNPEYDYGAIILDTPLGNRTGWFGFGTYSDNDLENVTGEHLGLPGRQAERHPVVRGPQGRLGRAAQGLLRHRHRRRSVGLGGVSHQGRFALRHRRARLRRRGRELRHADQPRRVRQHEGVEDEPRPLTERRPSCSFEVSCAAPVVRPSRVRWSSIVTAPVDVPDIAALTGDDGTFVVTAPAPGRYRLGVRADDHGEHELVVDVGGDVDVEVVLGHEG